MRSVVFILTVLLASFAAGAQLEVGVARVNINPKKGVSLDGTISQNGPVVEIHDDIHVRSLVFKNGQTKIGIAVVDSTMISDSIVDKAKAIIHKETGIPGSHLIIAATHTHSTPRAVVGLIKEDSHRDYLESLSGKIAESVILANRSLAPARMGWGSFQAPEHVHNRRWFVEQGSGTASPFGKRDEMVKMNPGRAGLVKPAGPVDPEFFLVSVVDTQGKPRSILGNYGLHYVGGTGRGKVSADYFGRYSEKIGSSIGSPKGGSFLGILTNGSSGDVNAIDYSKPRQRFQAYENIERIANDLVKRSVPVIKSIRHHGELDLDAVEGILKLQVRKPDSSRLEWARKTRAPENMRLRLSRPQVYAREALALANYPDEVDVRIQAIRIGGLAMVSIPNEVFAATGLQIKNQSPFPGSTFVIELANGYHGYLPDAKQHEWGGYETWPARSSYLKVRALKRKSAPKR